MKRSKARRCPQCKGDGFIMFMESPITTTADGKSQIAVMDKTFAKLCPQCRGVGSIGIPQLGCMTPNQLKELVSGRSRDDVRALLTGKTDAELDAIVKMYT